MPEIEEIVKVGKANLHQFYTKLGSFGTMM